MSGQTSGPAAQSSFNPGKAMTSGGAPGGAAGGDLGGTYPNPTVTNGSHLGAATVPTSSLASTTGSGAVVLATSPTLVTPALGTPSAVNLTNATSLPGSAITTPASVSSGNGASVTIQGGATTASPTQSGGAVLIQGGTASSAGDIGGTVSIIGGTGPGGSAGAIDIESSGGITIGTTAAGTVQIGQSSTPATIYGEKPITTVAGTSTTLVRNTRITNTNAGLCTATLPTTFAIGDTFEIIGQGAGGWKLAQPAGVTIHLNSTATTTGTGGSLASGNQWNCVKVTCVVANTTLVVNTSSGTLTVN